VNTEHKYNYLQNDNKTDFQWSDA